MTMTRGIVTTIVFTLATLAGLTAPAAASFHFMQIEQVVGTVCGNTDAQLIQLRMRSSGQNLVSGSRLIAFDANGSNPVTVLIIPSNVAVSTSGARILIASPAAAAQIIGEDFTMTAIIPAPYLLAGRLTFTDPSGTVTYWSLAWGAYTGSNAGDTTNDPNGNFGPPFGSPLYNNLSRGVQFQGAAGASSTTNAADYALTADDATFVNNAGTPVDLPLDCIWGTNFETGTAEFPTAVP